MKRKDSDQDDQEFNTPFDQWLRDNKPSEPKYTLDVESSLAGFQKKMEAERVARVARLKRAVVQGSVTMCIVLLSVGVFNMTDVGSDGFWMVEVVGAKTGGRVMMNEFRGDGFNVFNTDSDQKIQDLNAKIAGSEGVVTKAEGWHINGVTYWTIWREYIASDEKRIVASLSQGPETKYSGEYLAFLNNDWKRVEKNINSGEILQNDYFTTEILDGVNFSLVSWTFETAEGRVIYYLGQPIH